MHAVEDSGEKRLGMPRYAQLIIGFILHLQASFEKAKSWVKELQRQANPNIVIALVGNKLDLVAAQEGAAKVQKQSSADADEQDDDDDDDNDESETVTGEGAGSSSAPSTAATARAVPVDEAKAYADEAGLLFFETSAKTGEGVMELFTEIAKKIPVEQIVAAQQRNKATAAGSGSGSGGGAGGQQAGGRRSGGVDLGASEGANRDACNC